MKRYLFFIGLIPTIIFASRDNGCKFPDSKSPFADAGKRFMFPLSIVTAIAERDWFGSIYSQVLIHSFYMTNRRLEQRIGKKRPCGCSGALPSGHMMMYVSSASFLQYRYGWKVALPAYIMTLGFTYDRVHARAHSWGDVLTTAVFINIITCLVTPKFIPEENYSSKSLFTVVPTLEYGNNLTMLGAKIEF